ncbi:hypothetical protein QBC32DRAFT_369078 [Pseudoneurospora amorphoporcata]|uniref:Uncharacterized protein n=1 Tax=Pseudoneurospora amorphoporcata TaxID=241081 RepID=A0AAN6NXQ8_9PEZI|nr:hypothetical protein QBC32DRAFT_369078 [Pseudoneurospora amorphoporcata]
MKVKKPRANQSCHRRPTPDAFAVEHYRHEGDSGPEDDGSPDDLRRRRSRSSTSRQRDGKKTVQWADELEQESPEQMSEPATATLRTKSAMKRGPANQQEKEEEKPEDMTEGLAKLKIAEDDTAQEVQACTLRRDRRSSISRPKRTMARSDTTKPTVCSSAALDRPPSPLIPSARDFSFDNQPEVLTVDSRSAHQSRPANATWTKDNPPLPRSTSSYFQAKPKRNGSIRPPPAKSPAAQRTSGLCSKRPESSQDVMSEPKHGSPSTPLPSSTCTNFDSVKDFWSDLGASSSCVAVVCGSSSSSSRDMDLPKKSMVSSFMFSMSSALPSSYRPATKDTAAAPAAKRASCQSHMHHHSFVTCNSSLIPPGAQRERYCDCDDCVWSKGQNLTSTSTVARVGNEKEKERCRARK